MNETPLEPIPILEFVTTTMVARYDQFDSRHEEDVAYVFTDGSHKYVQLPNDADIHEIVLKPKD